MSNKFWGPHGEFLGWIGDHAGIPIPGDKALSWAAAIAAPFIIVLVITVLPSIPGRWKAASKEVEANRVIAEERAPLGSGFGQDPAPGTAPGKGPSTFKQIRQSYLLYLPPANGDARPNSPWRKAQQESPGLKHFANGEVGPDEKTPSWIVGLADDPDDAVYLGETDAKDYAKELFRRHYPDWELKGVEESSEVWIAKFMLKQPKTDPGRKYVSTLTFNKQWGSSMDLLQSLAKGGQSVPREAQLNELPGGTFRPDKSTPKWITRLTRLPVQSVTLTKKQATEYAKEMYRRHKPNWKLVGSDKQGDSWTFRFRLTNPKTEAGKNYIAGLTVSSDWKSSRELLQSLADGTLGIPSGVK